MTDILRQVALETPEPTSWTDQKVADAAALPPLAKAEPDPGASYSMPFATAASHSRLPSAVPPGTWRIRWELPVASAPAYVLQAGPRAIAVGGGRWELFDLSGRAIRKGSYTSSLVSAHEASGLFFFVDENNFLLAHRLSSGEREFMTAVTYGETFVRPHLFRHEQRILWSAYERDTYPHSPGRPPRSLIEMRELSPKTETDSFGLLFSLTDDARLYLATRQLSTAALGKQVVAAIPGAVLFASDRLEPQRRLLTETAEPAGLALDETGRVYLVAQQGEDRTLWIITPQGQRLRLPLSRDWGPFLAPPIIGLDHRVFLVTAGRALCFAPDGKLLWENIPGASIAGAAVAADGTLLVSAGARVLGISAAGQARVLRDFEGDSLTTPPVLTRSGELLVASRQKLYSLLAR